MLRIQFSNRIETLCDAVVDALGVVPTSPFAAQQIVVPSSAMRRHLTLSIAARHGICANVEAVYLAQWLWTQIAKVVSTVAVKSPFAADSLAWRIYQMLQEGDWTRFPRLRSYLDDPNDVMRFELAAEVASVFEQYITYRQDWMAAWLEGDDAAMPKASAAQLDDQAWQAEIWRRISGGLGATPEHPASVFLRRLATADAGEATPFDLPETVHVFCLPAMPPLYLDVLTGLARWINVTVYVLNPCREYWFDIVDPKRLHTLAVRGAATYHESGNRLLASWGKQTKAYIELLLASAGDAPIDDAHFADDFPATRLGGVQSAILNLTELEPGSLPWHPHDRSIEVHACHSLTRELEVLQDQLLALFAGPAPPRPDEVLIVMPDLETAAPLIEAVFGNVSGDRRLPYTVSGRGRSTVNGAARALLALLGILPSRFPASALVELLQQPLIGRRFDIGVEELQVVEDWLQISGIRWGLNAEHRRALGVPATERFSIADGLDRLFMGYALPQNVAEPTFGRIPAGNAEGSSAEILGSFGEFIERLTVLRADLKAPRLAEEWLAALLGILDSMLAPTDDDLEEVVEVRETLRELHDNMLRGGLRTPVPLTVLRASLESLFADGARGGVPTGSITFSSMSSLRNLPFRFIGILGLEDGAFPSASRPREFDLMAAAPRAGDRQRRLDDRNLFLDLLLAARERLYLSYTGRSIRDNSVRPPSVVVAELVEALLPALAHAPGDAAALAEARDRLIVEHPLQAFDAGYFRDDDPRRRSYNRELCDALRQAEAGHDAAAADACMAGDDNGNGTRGDGGDGDGDGDGDEEDDAAEDAAADDRALPRFFRGPLAAPGPEWRQVTLDRLQEFFRNPAHFLLRQRLGMALYREAGSVADEEPFLPEWGARQALAERLLPHAMQGLGPAELRRLAEAGVEYPPGAVGTAAILEEMSALQRFAAEVRESTRAPVMPPLAIDLPFVLDGEAWRVNTVLSGRRAAGLTLHRYDDTRAGDYLAAWLTHLVAAAASDAPTETHWISRNGSFRFSGCRDARSILDGILRLYRRGLCEPVHFFPKTAWRYIDADRNLNKAREAWQKKYGKGKGEDRHAAYKLALRGIADPLDAEFRAAAETVFGAAPTYLDDPRPRS